MAFTTIEIIALIFVILGLLKIIIVFFSAKSWMNFAKGIYKNPVLLFIVELVLAAIVFYYLLQSFTIVQIMACVVFGALLTGLTFAVYAKELMPAFTKVFKAGIVKKAWLPLIIWVILLIWTLTAIF